MIAIMNRNINALYIGVAVAKGGLMAEHYRGNYVSVRDSPHFGGCATLLRRGITDLANYET